MERDFGKELDELKNEVKRLGELLDGKAAAGKPQDGVERVGHIQRIPNMHPDPRLSSLMGDLESKSGAAAPAARSPIWAYSPRADGSPRGYGTASKQTGCWR